MSETNKKVVGRYNGLKTIRGYSPYELALINGYKGTVEEWLESLKGKSAYDYAKEGGYTGTEEEFAVRLAAILSGKG